MIHYRKIIDGYPRIQTGNNSSTLYPLPPKHSKVLLRQEDPPSLVDRIAVAASSLFFVGSVVWVPSLVILLWRKWKNIPQSNKRKRIIVGGILLSVIAVYVAGPHRTARVGEWAKIRKWNLWKRWFRYLALEVVLDGVTSQQSFDPRKERSIIAFVPHGIFPFSLAFGVLPDAMRDIFGTVRPVVATATKFLFFVNDILQWLGAVDASKQAIEEVITNDKSSSNIGIIPGGIAEIFEGYPKEGVHKDEEIAIVRKGFLNLAVKYGLPVLPVYCFGSSRLMRRLDFPLLEKISLMIRASLCIFYGVFGLPIPFPSKLLYVIGKPIRPDESLRKEDRMLQMYKEFCVELRRIFNEYKACYGWQDKELKLITL